MTPAKPRVASSEPSQSSLRAAGRPAGKLRHAPGEQGQDGGADGEIDEEDPAPAAMLHEPAAKDGADGGGDGGEAGPGADGAAAIFIGKGDAEQGEAAGDQERASDSLQAAGEDELADSRGEAAPDRGHGKQDDPGGKDFAAAVEIAKRAAGEQQ